MPLLPPRQMRIEAEPFKVPQQIQKMIYAMESVAKSFSKALKKQFDFSSVFSDFSRKFSTIFKFNVINDIVNKLQQNMTSMFSSITDGFKDSLKGLQKFKEWYKSVFSNFGKTIGKQIAQDIRQNTTQAASWLRKNKKQLQGDLRSFGISIGHLLSSFAEGIIAIIDAAKTFVGMFDGLPDVIKGASYAVLALFAIVKTGPIGAIVALVALAGDLVTDKSNYKYNKQRGLEYGDDGYIDVAFKSIWAILDGQDLDIEQKTIYIAQILLDKFFQGATGFFQITAPQILERARAIIGYVCDTIQIFFDFVAGQKAEGNVKDSKQSGSFTQFICDLIILAFKSSSGILSSIVVAITSALLGKPSSQWQDAFGQKGNAMLSSFMTYFALTLAGMSPAISLVVAVLSLVSNSPIDQNGKSTAWTAQTMMEQAYAMFERIVWLFAGLLKTASNLTDQVVDMLVTVLNTAFGETALSKAVDITSEQLTQQQKKQNSANREALSGIITGLVSGIAAYIISGKNIVATILVAITGFVSGIFADAFEQATDKQTKRIDWSIFKDKFLDGLKEKIEALKRIGLAIIDTISDVILSLWDITEDVRSQIVGFIANILQIDEESDEYVMINDGVTVIAGMIISTIMNGGNLISSVITTFVTSAFTIFAQARKGITKDGGIKPLSEYTEQDWSDIFDSTTQRLSELAQNTWGTIVKIYNFFVEKWTEPGGWGDQLRQWWSGSESQDGFSGIIGSLVDGVNRAFEWIAKRIADNVSPIAEEISWIIGDMLWSDESIWSAYITYFADMHRQTRVTKTEDGRYFVKTQGYGSAYLQIPQDATQEFQAIIQQIAQLGGVYVGQDGKVHVGFLKYGVEDEALKNYSGSVTTINGGWGDSWWNMYSTAYGSQDETWGDIAADIYERLTTGQTTDQDFRMLKYGAIAPKAISWENGSFASPTDIIRLASLNNAFKGVNKQDRYDALIAWMKEYGFGDVSSWGTMKMLETFGLTVSQFYQMMQMMLSMDTQDDSFFNSLGGKTGWSQFTADSVEDRLAKGYLYVPKDVNIETRYSSFKKAPSFTFTVQPVITNITLDGSTDVEGYAFGGRIDSPRRVIVGQDGPQYVIPVSKPQRAVSLIQRMVVEMGGSVKDFIVKSLGLNGYTISNTIANGTSIYDATSANLSYVKSQQYQSTINIKSEGTDAYTIGKSVVSSVNRSISNTLHGIV